jgi:hypothetical protein
MKKYSIISIFTVLSVLFPFKLQNSPQELQNLIQESFNYFPKIKELRAISK